MFQNNKTKDAKFKAIISSMHDRALAKLLKDKDFRFYMSELLGYCKTFENAFNEKGNVAAFNNGLQSAGQKIYEDIMLISPEAIITMCKEEQEILALRNQLKDNSEDK